MSGMSRPVVVLVVLLLAVVGGVGVAVLLTDTEELAEPADDEEEEEEELHVAPLTGELVEEPLEHPVIATKVENTAEARPQAGLAEADVVFEVLTEGGITRFLALYHQRLPERVGPIRSGRLVDVDLAPAYDPILAISGARPEVLEALDDRLHLVTETPPPVFSRSRDRPSPHNLYLHPHELLATTDDRPDPPDEPVWAFDEEPPEGGVPAEELTIGLSPASETGWRYDEQAGTYARLQDGDPHEIEGPDEIAAANVVVMGAEVEPLEDGLVRIEVIGQGQAVVLRDGQRYDVRWQREDATSPVELVDGEDVVLPLKPGPTWVVVPPTPNVPPAGG